MDGNLDDWPIKIPFPCPWVLAPGTEDATPQSYSELKNWVAGIALDFAEYDVGALDDDQWECLMRCSRWAKTQHELFLIVLAWLVAATGGEVEFSIG